MKIRTTIALSACLSLVSLGVSAQAALDGNIDVSGNGYIGVDGSVLKTGLGECLVSGDFSADNAINACEGIADDVAEAAAPAAEAVAKAPAAAPAQQAKVDTREFNEQTLFDTNSAQLSSSGQSVMNSLFGALAEYKGITGIMVTGHTDSRGSEEYNQALSERRAQAVAAAIGSKYPDARIDVKGMGEATPVASNDTAEGRQLNRRVEIDVTATRMTFN